MKKRTLVCALASVVLSVHAQTNRSTVVFVEAHPDDLASHAGTAILMAEKFDVKLIDFTRGENGLGEKEFRDGSCAKKRVEEEKRACKFLNTEPVFMDEVNYKGSMAYANEKTTRKMAELFTAWKPRAVFLHWPLDIHPDHVQSTAAALHALSLAKLSPEIYFHSQPIQTRNFQPAYRVDVSRLKDRKAALVRCYACQGPEELLEQFEIDSVFRSRRIGTWKDLPSDVPRLEPFAVWDGSVKQGKSVLFELNAPVY